MNTQRSPRGVTMLELIIAVSVFSMVIAVCFMITLRTTKSFGEQIHEGTLNDKSEKVLKSMEEELGDASLIASTTDPSSTGVFNVTANSMTFYQAEIHYKVPLRYVNPTNNPKGYTVFINPVVIQLDANGNQLNFPTFPNDNAGGGDFDFRLRYGWRDNARFIGNADDNNKLVPLQGPGLKPSSSSSSLIPSGVTTATSSFTVDYVNYSPGTLKGGFMCYRFQPDNTLRVGKYGANGILSEYYENIDIDGDGSMTSSFAVGYLERCYYVGDVGYEQLVPESCQRIGDGVVLQPIANVSGPADQLKSNRIFNRDPNNPARLNIFLWMFTMDGEGQPHMVQSKVSIFMRNNATYVTSTSATGTN